LHQTPRRTLQFKTLIPLEDYPTPTLNAGLRFGGEIQFARLGIEVNQSARKNPAPSTGTGSFSRKSLQP
jgi:hypothetical protein